MALVAVLSSTVIGSARPAFGAPASPPSIATLNQEIAHVAEALSAAGQQGDAMRIAERGYAAKAHQADVLIGRDERAVIEDRAALQRAAVNAYVTSGSTASTNPMFVPNPNELGPASVYEQVAEGSLSVSVAALTNAQQTLAGVQRHYHSAARHAAEEAAALIADRAHYDHLLGVLHRELAQAKESAAQAAAAAAQASAVQYASYHPPTQVFPAPPPNSQANIAVRAALAELGKPYCWAGTGPSCFDCSGLTMVAWAAAGVSLPHYSGAQMADSTPVPVSDLMPGDLLFYGPGGSDHVAMYLGGGQMIEAPYTGAVVWVTPVRLGDNFAGAGRP
jgi:cell wall-associated NlpC family hydrolase